jgi:hypothetical protein
MGLAPFPSLLGGEPVSLRPVGGAHFLVVRLRTAAAMRAGAIWKTTRAAPIPRAMVKAWMKRFMLSP